MTYDFRIGHVCPHLTVEEEVPLGEDRRSLITRQPVASANYIRITANNSIDLPASGTQSQAMITGRTSAPFSIPAYAKTLVLLNRTSSVSIDLPTGTRVSSEDVIRVIKTKLQQQQAKFSVSERNGYLVFEDTLDRGPSSILQVAGDAATRLGFDLQVRARGRTVFPGWEMAEQQVLNPYANSDLPAILTARYPRFKGVVRSNPVFKVTYTTYRHFCLRCVSYGTENDYRTGQDGEYLTVRDDDKLNQDGIKILTTIRGSNPYHPEYGSNLLTRIGIKALGTGTTLITEDVTRALTILQRIQGITGKYQDLTPKETLQSILSVVTTPSTIDPTIFAVDIVISNASSEPITINTVFSAPQAAALAGTNGLSFGLTERGINPNLRSIPGVLL